MDGSFQVFRVYWLRIYYYLIQIVDFMYYCFRAHEEETKIRPAAFLGN